MRQAGEAAPAPATSRPLPPKRLNTVKLQGEGQTLAESLAERERSLAEREMTSG